MVISEQVFDILAVSLDGVQHFKAHINDVGTARGDTYPFGEWWLLSRSIFPCRFGNAYEARPWGEFLVLTGEGLARHPVAVKILTISGASRLSLQRHALRLEEWTPLDPDLKAEIDGVTYDLIPYAIYRVPQGITHRISNPGTKPGRLVEVIYGQYAEDNIERLADDYERS